MDEREEVEVKKDVVEAEEGGLGGVLALEATGLLTQDAESGGPTIVDVRNRFNDLSQLVMLWTVCHRWPAGLRFMFN